MTIRDLLYFIAEIKDIDLDAEIRVQGDGDDYGVSNPRYNTESTNFPRLDLGL